MSDMEKEISLYKRFIKKYCLGSPDNSYLIRTTLLLTNNKGRDVGISSIRESWEDFLKNDFNESEIKFYNHIPFCFKRCHFCCYSSNKIQSPDDIGIYVKKMLDHYRYFKPVFRGHDFSSLYIGGGTPSVLNPAQMKELFSGLFSFFRFDKEGQKCIEFNPSSCSYEKLKIARDFGFNKISFGVQSLSSKVLKENNRSYQTAAMVNKAVSDAKKLDFETVSIDLLSGLWGDSGKELINSFKKIMDIGPDSIYIYSVQPTENYLKDICQMNEEEFAGHKRKIMDSVSERIFDIAQKEKYYTHGFTGTKISMRERDVLRFTKKGHDFEKRIASNKKGNSSIFGLGTYSYSYIYKRMFYTINDDLSSDPKKSRFWVNSYDEKRDMVNFIYAGFSGGGSISLSGFKNIFKKDFFDEFKDQVERLKKIGAFTIEGDMLRLSPSIKDGWVLPFLFFVDKKEIESLMKKPIRKLSLRSNDKKQSTQSDG